jgi:hypothetical protein
MWCFTPGLKSILKILSFEMCFLQYSRKRLYILGETNCHNFQGQKVGESDKYPAGRAQLH